MRGRRKRSRGYRVRDSDGKLIPALVKRAKAEAAELSSKLIKGERPTAEVTFERLSMLFEREVVTGLSSGQQAAVRRELELWRSRLGPQFVLSRIGPKEWNEVSRMRRSGEIDARGQAVLDPELRSPVGERAVEKTLKLLRQLCLFGMKYRTASGDPLLVSDPTHGLTVPTVKNPKRPVADSDRFEKLVAVADKVTMIGADRHRVRSYLRELLVIAADTGRRVSSILGLRWGDWRPDEGLHGVIHWRAEHDKIGRAWTAPVTSEVKAALESLRMRRPVEDDSFIFASPTAPERSVTRHAATSWLRRAEQLAGLEHLPGGSWHAFRRGWASQRKHLSVVDVAAAGGWVDTTTLLKCYQHADSETIEAVVLGGRRLKMVG
jgi:integrase